LAHEALKMAEPQGVLFRGLRGGMVTVDSPRQKIIKILGRSTTTHGIRSTFRDWCARESIDWEVAEMCLSHEVRSMTERAYQRDDLIERRREVLERWSAEVLKEGNSPLLKID
jgi:integrase